KCSIQGGRRDRCPCSATPGCRLSETRRSRTPRRVWDWSCRIRPADDPFSTLLGIYTIETTWKKRTHRSAGSPESTVKQLQGTETKPKISVVIPVYCGATTIGALVEGPVGALGGAPL